MCALVAGVQSCARPILASGSDSTVHRHVDPRNLLMYQLDSRILRNNVQCSVVRPAIYDDVLQRLHIACLTRDALDAVAYRVSHVQHRRYDGEGYQLRLLISGLTIFSLVAKTAPQRSRETTPGKPRPFGFRRSEERG